ncbi:hypothetical protein CTI12_AA235950 [Artemisia annua]|uniref:Uncharacterized protein n=1 Tax=Artemisia annua TaxID=35608 RepID=A0A2U1NRX2_ARTAN|nr:hypothetical protein CTI12_AA235950 [Artemisia annua]
MEFVTPEGLRLDGWHPMEETTSSWNWKFGTVSTIDRLDMSNHKKHIKRMILLLLNI